jgi:hypothetical protein
VGCAAALKADGSITTWGDMENPWSNIENIRKNIPTDKGYIEIYSNEFAFLPPSTLFFLCVGCATI